MKDRRCENCESWDRILTAKRGETKLGYCELFSVKVEREENYWCQYFWDKNGKRSSEHKKRTILCPTCEGTGSIDDGTIGSSRVCCTICWGYGRITPEKLQEEYGNNEYMLKKAKRIIVK